MDKFKEEIAKDISILTPKGKLLFAALTCEKLYSNYVFFKKITSWGRPEILLNGINLMYQSILKLEVLDPKIIKDTAKLIDIETPDTEDFPEVFTSFALDACTSINCGLNYLLTNKNEYIEDIAVCARDTVYMYVSEKYFIDSSGTNDNLNVEKHPLMIKETNRQKLLLIKLASLILDALTIEIIQGLRDNHPIIVLPD